MSAPFPPAAPAGHVHRLDQLAHLLDGRLEGDGSRLARSYAVDSRAAAAGTVFFALKGERTDGHRFLDAVLAAQASAAVVQGDATVPPGLAVIRVADPAQALTRLGEHFRSAWPLTVVGVTGSAGKTTTKDFAAALLAPRLPVFKSEGNLNSTIGLPLTLARRRPEERLAVLELGMSFPGELSRLSALARPDVAVITNVGLAHARNFRSADDVALAKREILDGVPKDGVFVANADDGRVMAMTGQFPGKVVTFGVTAPADVRALAVAPLGAEGTRFEVAVPGGKGETVLPVVGAHHVRNVLAALAAALALDVDPLGLLPGVAGLAAGEHRGRLLRLAGPVLLLDDCYNSSPAALHSSLEALATLPGTRRVAILGDMLELGAFAEAAHREAGRQAARVASSVLAVGPESAALAEEAHAYGCRDVQHVPDAETAAAMAPGRVADGDCVLVKASRGIGLEKVVEAIGRARSQG